MSFMLDTVALGQTFYECCGSAVLLLFCQCSVLFIFIASFSRSTIGQSLGHTNKTEAVLEIFVK